MSSSASKLLTVVTIGVTLTVSVSVYRTVTDEQLRAMEQCEPACNLGGPLLSGPFDLIPPVVLLILVTLMITSAVAGWPVRSAQMRP